MSWITVTSLSNRTRQSTALPIGGTRTRIERILTLGKGFAVRQQDSSRDSGAFSRAHTGSIARLETLEGRVTLPTVHLIFEPRLWLHRRVNDRLYDYAGNEGQFVIGLPQTLFRRFFAIEIRHIFQFFVSQARGRVQVPYSSQRRLFEADQHSRYFGLQQPGRRPERIPYLIPGFG